jgi:hypothetical protein
LHAGLRGVLRKPGGDIVHQTPVMSGKDRGAAKKLESAAANWIITSGYKKPEN